MPQGNFVNMKILTETTDITIIEISSENNYGYHDFFLEGLTRHSEFFKIAPDELQESQFPTQGTADSFTLAAINTTGQLMGVVSFQPIMKDRKKLAHKGELIRMYVAQEYGGKNVGSILITTLIKRVKTTLQAIEQINLNVATHNEKAIKLYQKHGFLNFGTERNAMKFNNEYFDDDYMALALK